jgi:hypothetical protein
MMCSHGGRFLPCGPDGAIRYVGGVTRVLVVPRSVSFRELAEKLAEMACGAIVSAVRYRLADDDGVLVSATCDDELAHMRDDYDRLKATRPSASFRVFFSGQRRGGSGRPPLPPKVRRVQSEPALAAPARARVHCAAAAPAPMRRVQSAQEFARRGRFQPICYDRRHHCYCGCNRRHGQHEPASVPSPMPPPTSTSKNAQGARQEPAPEAATSKNSRDAKGESQEPADVMSPAKATTNETASSRDTEAAEPYLRAAFWEFE